MPGIPEEKQQQLIPVVPPTPDMEETIQQPRQPHNLQGLLRFAMEASDGTTSTSTTSVNSQPLSAENQQFLQEALKSMTVDVIAVLQENITKLQSLDNISPQEVAEKVEAFEHILEYVDNIDIANDFHKINGFSIFEPCLRCKYAELRIHVCDLIAELAQNNPYIQSVICETTNVVCLLIATLSQDDSPEVRVKALYAISCICRESSLGYANFQQHSGITVLRQVLQTGSDKLKTKAAFLLTALHHMDPKLLNMLLADDFLTVIVNALQIEHQSSHEHLLHLLTILLEKPGSLLGAGLHQRVKETIIAHNAFVQGKVEFSEEQEYCKKILELLKSK